MIITIWCATHEKGPYVMCGQRRPCAESGHFFVRLKESVDMVVYVDEKKMPGLDCTDAHADLDLHYPQVA